MSSSAHTVLETAILFRPKLTNIGESPACAHERGAAGLANIPRASPVALPASTLAGVEGVA